MGIIHCNLRVLMAEKNLNIQKVKDNTSFSRTTISNLYNNYGSGVHYDTLS
ncbi:helix-turn-helix domain-containing protein, partial [Robertmurraya sp. Marseille-Q9965]